VSASPEGVGLACWQALFCLHHELFDGLDGDARLGFAAAREPTMMVYRRDNGGWSGSMQPFPGIIDAAVDLLMIVDTDAMVKLSAAAPDDRLYQLRRQVRLGNVVGFRQAGQEQLLARGFADLMEALGMDDLARMH
jgi:hypothetical protein